MNLQNYKNLYGGAS